MYLCTFVSAKNAFSIVNILEFLKSLRNTGESEFDYKIVIMLIMLAKWQLTLEEDIYKAVGSTNCQKLLTAGALCSLIL